MKVISKFKTKLDGVYLSIYREEWKRAKRIIHFSKGRPSVKWAYLRDRVHADYFGPVNAMRIATNYQQKDFVGSKLETEFRTTIRHELAHIVSPFNHGPEFKQACARLGGFPTATISLPPVDNSQSYKTIKRGREVTKVQLDPISFQYQLAVTNLKRATTRFKRAKTLLQKRQAKVKYYQRVLAKSKQLTNS